MGTFARVIDIAAYVRRQPWGRALAPGSWPPRAEPAAARGEGAVIGLVDAALAAEVADLAGASVRVRAFARRPATASALRDHGTCSASLLVGQGARHVLGVAPRASLYVATVSEEDGLASPARVAKAIGWLTDVGATTIAVPMGDRDGDDALARAVSRAADRGAVVLAACGDDPSGAPMFPARHRAVRGVTAPRGMAVPAVGSDGAVRPRRGSSIACALAAGLVALERAASSRP